MFTLLATMLPVSQDVMETAWEDFKYEDDPAYKSSMQREFFYRALMCYIIVCGTQIWTLKFYKILANA